MRVADYMLMQIALCLVLHKDEDYEVDEKARTVQFTESGNDKVEKAFRCRKSL